MVFWISFHSRVTPLPNSQVPDDHLQTGLIDLRPRMKVATSGSPLLCADGFHDRVHDVTEADDPGSVHQVGLSGRAPSVMLFCRARSNGLSLMTPSGIVCVLRRLHSGESSSQFRRSSS